MTLTDLMGNVCIVCTICLFLTGIQTCYGIYMKGSVGDILSLPFISMLAK